MAGYSGTPLPKKLGIKPSMLLVAVDAPPEYRAWLGELPPGARVSSQLAPHSDAVHLFVKRRASLEKRLAALRDRLEPTGFVWVSWPKRASNVETDVTEDVVREVALPLGFVDIKVCAVSDVWSGLKLVVRRSARAR